MEMQSHPALKLKRLVNDSEWVGEDVNALCIHKANPMTIQLHFCTLSILYLIHGDTVSRKHLNVLQHAEHILKYQQGSTLFSSPHQGVHELLSEDLAPEYMPSRRSAIHAN